MLIAILLPKIEVVLAYKGAVFGSFIIFIFPGLRDCDDCSDDCSLIRRRHVSAEAVAGRS